MNSENDFSNNLAPKYGYVHSKNITKIGPPVAFKGAKTPDLLGLCHLDPTRSFAPWPHQGP